MIDLSKPAYDKPREWIRTSREHGIAWDEILLARKSDDKALQRGTASSASLMAMTGTRPTSESLSRMDIRAPFKRLSIRPVRETGRK